MRDVRELLVVQIRLFPADQIPLDLLAAPSAQQALVESFSFQESGVGLPWMGIQIPGTAPSITLPQGEFTDEKGSKVSIRSLEIQPRRIVTRVAGTSEQADAFFRRFREVISELAPERAPDLTDVVYKAEETSCVVTLGFELSQIFRRNVSTFVRRRLARAASAPTIRANVEPTKFTARIAYEVNEPSLKEHGITLNPKEFVIEPRAGTPTKSRIFFTKSPFPSSVHLELIQEFEDLFSK